MKKLSFLFLITVVIFLLFSQSCRPKVKSPVIESSTHFDSALITPFFEAHPVLKKYEENLLTIYRNCNYTYIWFDKDGIVEYGNSLYSKVKDVEDEGISGGFPYQQKIDGIFSDAEKNPMINTDTELMLTSLYLYYVDKVYKGIDPKTTHAMEWLLPRKKVSLAQMLDSLIIDEKSGNQDADNQILISQYYELRDVLKQYREIEKQGGWKPIELHPDGNYKPNDTGRVIRQIRDRLFITHDIKQNTRSNRYDSELLEAVNRYQVRNGYQSDSLISPDQIQNMNLSVGERIKTIVINMERCRWLSPDIFNSREYIFVNIPSFELSFFRDEKVEFHSSVVVGKTMSKTVIFGGKMSYIVFSPYWNLPESIIEDEVKPGIAKNKNYLKKHNMEWNNGQVRQLPGKNNSLGLVKFMFPNSNEIYFHDTPSKGLFKEESRAFSHGCVRVDKARELAITILKEDEKWTVEKIDESMNSGKENIASLKNKIPVHIGYFTAWVDKQGEINFYKDVYERDERLAALMFYKE
jgi:L,D-transpeptidase YcbB